MFEIQWQFRDKQLGKSQHKTTACFKDVFIHYPGNRSEKGREDDVSHLMKNIPGKKRFLVAVVNRCNR